MERIWQPHTKLRGALVQDTKGKIVLSIRVSKYRTKYIDYRIITDGTDIPEHINNLPEHAPTMRKEKKREPNFKLAQCNLNFSWKR